MSPSDPTYATLDDWIAREAIAFSVDSVDALNAAVDRMMAALGPPVELLGLGEALHGDEGLLVFRNRLFRRLVETHGYSAIAVESSFPRAHLVNEYVCGRGPTTYEAVQDGGFSHGFGRSVANRELVEWMRQYNARPSGATRLRFYGFDGPTEMTGTDSPRRLITFALDYLASIDGAGARERRRRVEALLGDDAAWENPEAMMDPAKSIGLSPGASALRIETEDLITELGIRRPELISGTNRDRYLEAARHASLARQLLTYHAALARPSTNRVAELLGIRDLMMADNLAYAAERERERGKVLAFAHNHHLKRGRAHWQLGPHSLTWWPAGSHLSRMLGTRYAVIGSAVGVLGSHGIPQPEPGTLEAHLTRAPGPARLIPTHPGRGLSPSAIAALPTRSGSTRNSTYFPLTLQSLTDFDWLVALT